MTQAPLEPSAVRQVSVAQTLGWLVLGMRDLVKLRWISLAHGLVLTAVGGCITLVAHDRFWLLAGALSGFLFIAPVLAASLYALSRELEHQQPARWNTVWRTWTNWQASHHDKLGNDYWCMVQFGLLLALASTGWVLTSAALITLLSPIPIQTPVDFLRLVVGAKEGWLFEIWLALGGVMAAPIFASSVITMPLLLDLARKPVFLHDNSVPTLDALLDSARGDTAPHAVYLDADERALRKLAVDRIAVVTNLDRIVDRLLDDKLHDLFLGAEIVF